MAEPFGPDAVAEIMAHMNGDHAADNVLIVQALAGCPQATQARMSGLDADGIEFEVTEPSGVSRVRLPFSHRLTERAQVRAEVVAMFKRAGGVAHGQH